MMSPNRSSPSPDNLTKWFFTYTKLKFFTRMSCVLCSRTTKKQQQRLITDTVTNMAHQDRACKDQEDSEKGINVNSSKVRDSGDDWMVNLQRSVKMLHFGNWDEKELAAEEIEKLVLVDAKRRRIVAELGVIPPLVAMVGLSRAVGRRRVAVRALVELGNGSFTNKAIMVDAGILQTLPENIDIFDETSKHEFAQLLSSLSLLANTHISLSSPNIIRIALSILKSCSRLETKQSCLNTLYNLSSALEYTEALTSTTIINTLLTLSSLPETSEKAVSTLGNLVVTPSGRKAIENNPTMPDILIEIMTWEESPRCQESSAYILMILAHQSSTMRRKMAKAGIVQVLLEVALLSSPLAQKRAMKLLQWFKDERQVKVGPHSGPQARRFSIGPVVNEKEVDERKRLMKKIVKQSLYKNMETITRRANGDKDSMKLKAALVMNSSSKSLPY